MPEYQITTALVLRLIYFMVVIALPLLVACWVATRPERGRVH